MFIRLIFNLLAGGNFIWVARAVGIVYILGLIGIGYVLLHFLSKYW